MPWLSLIWKYRKWIAYGLAVLAVVLLAWRVAAWRDGYLQRGAAVKALAVEKQAHDDDLRKIAQYIEQSEKARAQLAMDLDAIRVRFAELQKQSPRVTIRTVEVPIAPGQTTCPVPRVSAEFVSVYNAAGSP